VPLPQPILDELGQLWRSHRNRRWLFPNRHGDAPINKRVLSDQQFSSYGSSPGSAGEAVRV
jgi:hypothetical protein